MGSPIIAQIDWNGEAYVVLVALGLFIILVACIETIRAKSQSEPYYLTLAIAVGLVLVAAFSNDSFKARFGSRHQEWITLTPAQRAHYRTRNALFALPVLPLGLGAVWVTRRIRPYSPRRIRGGRATRQ